MGRRASFKASTTAGNGKKKGFSDFLAAAPRQIGRTVTQSRLFPTPSLRRVKQAFEHVVNYPLELDDPGGGQNDRVSAASDIFCDSKKPSARIFLESENKDLAFHLNLCGFQGFLTMRLAGMLRVEVSVRLFS